MFMIPSPTHFLRSYPTHSNSTTKRYNFNHLSHLLKALSASTKVAIRVNELGYAAFQFLMPRGTAPVSSRDDEEEGSSDCGFVDFYILPLEQIELEDQECMEESSETD